MTENEYKKYMKDLRRYLFVSQYANDSFYFEQERDDLMEDMNMGYDLSSDQIIHSNWYSQWYFGIGKYYLCA